LQAHSQQLKDKGARMGVTIARTAFDGAAVWVGPLLRRPADGRADYARAERRGRWGEAVAALWLQLQGFRVLAHRVRLRSGEVDLLVRRGDVIAAVEVKTRARIEEGYYAVDRESQQRIARTADAWLAARPGLRTMRRRLDLVVVAPWRLPVHVPDAWRVAAR
jgi:putative endonuclease